MNTLLLYIPLLALTDRQNYRQRNKYTRFAWAGGTFFPVVLLCCVSVWFWWEKGFDLHMHVLLRVQYSCGGVLVFGSGGKKVLVQICMYYLEYNTVVVMR